MLLLLLIKLMKEQWTYQILKIQLSKATEEALQFFIEWASHAD